MVPICQGHRGCTQPVQDNSKQPGSTAQLHHPLPCRQGFRVSGNAGAVDVHKLTGRARRISCIVQLLIHLLQQRWLLCKHLRRRDTKGQVPTQVLKQANILLLGVKRAYLSQGQGD